MSFRPTCSLDVRQRRLGDQLAFEDEVGEPLPLLEVLHRRQVDLAGFLDDILERLPRCAQDRDDLRAEVVGHLDLAAIALRTPNTSRPC